MTTEPADFLDLVKQRELGRLKIYIGMAAGVGKTYRMLQEAQDLKKRGIDVVVGFVETHGRVDTQAQIADLEVIPRRRIQYKGVTLEEMDVDALLERAPQVAAIDELAHTNVPGSQYEKRWEDVLDLLDAGINVITTVNIQHLESLNDVILRMLGVTVRETVPDWVVTRADQVVNVDISVEDLRQRLQDGKIYAPEKIPSALGNFFTPENLTTLRELALREVASSVDRIRKSILENNEGPTPRTVDRILVALSSDPVYSASLLRKGSRIAGRLNSDWYCVYVQTPEESAERIDSTVQRKLVSNIQLAQSLGADVVKLETELEQDIATAILRFARERGITLIIAGQSHQSWWQHLRRGSVVGKLISNSGGIDVLIVSPDKKPRSNS